MTQRVLALVEHPPIITALTAEGDIIAVHSYVTGLPQTIASWNAQNLHIFMVASLALVLSVPLGSQLERLRLTGWSLVLITLVTLAICVVQLKSVAEAYATANLGITLHTAWEKALLDWANRGLIMVGMLLLPAFLFLNSYLSFWSESQVRADGQDRRPAASRGLRHSSRMTWKRVLLAVAACASAWVLLLSPRANQTPEKELKGLNRILALNPASAHTHFSLGFHYEREERPEKALELYKAALRLDPNLVTAHFGTGNILFKQGGFEQAARSYEEVIKRDPGHASARFNLGNALLQTGLHARAAEAYDETLRINPNHASAHKNLAVALLRLGRPCEALPHLERSSLLDRRYSAEATLAAEISRLRSTCRSPQDTSRRITLPSPGLVDYVGAGDPQ